MDVRSEAFAGTCTSCRILGHVQVRICTEALSPAQQVSDCEQFRPELFKCEGLAVSSDNLGFFLVLLEVSFGPGNRKSFLVKQIFNV